ncbi:MAG: cupin domain-containing protein [bacterium]
MKTAAYWIRSLQLAPHPEGGFYREVYRCPEAISRKALPGRYTGSRAVSTSIYFLLRGGDVSRFHRLASDEIWHFHAGSPLTLHIIDPKGIYQSVSLGVEGHRRQQPQLVIKRHHWFAATVDNPREYTLMGCTVAPGFDFADFELADRDILVRRCPGKAALIQRLT